MAVLMVNVAPRHCAPGPSTCSPFYRHHPWKEQIVWMLFGRIRFTWTISSVIITGVWRKIFLTPKQDLWLINYWRSNFVISSIKPWHALYSFIAQFFSFVLSVSYASRVILTGVNAICLLPHMAFWLHTHKWIFDKHLCQNLVAASKLAITLHRLALSSHTHTHAHAHKHALACTHPYKKALHKHMASPP